MTVPTNYSRVEYEGNGSATVFDYTYKIFDADDLVVILTAADGTESTLVRGTHYSVDGVGNEDGGTVTLTGGPLATGDTLTILREIPVVQETDLRNQGAFYPETIEDELDRSRMIDQQLTEAQGRTLKQTKGGGSYDAKGRRIANLGAPVDGDDAANKQYVDGVLYNSEQYQDLVSARDRAEDAAVDAGLAAGVAMTARDQSVAASEASGDVRFFDTKADADSALANDELADGEVVEIFADETRGGEVARYRNEAGVLVYKWAPAGQVVTAEGTEGLDPPDTLTLKELARRSAYQAATQIATGPTMVAGFNVVPLSSLEGGAVNPERRGFIVKVIRAGAVVTLADQAWSYDKSAGELTVEAQDGDRLLTVEREQGGHVTTSTGTQTIAGALDDRVNKGGVGAEPVTTLTGEKTVEESLKALESSRRGKSLSRINTEKPPSPWGLSSPINILGDSISHGAFAGQLYYNGWTRIFGRMASNDLGGLSYQGYVPITALGSGATDSRDIHGVNFIGTWTAQDSSLSANGAAAYNGHTFQTVTQNDRINSTIPTFQSQALVWYLQQPGGGELTISDNTGVLAVIATDGPLSPKAFAVALVDDGQGSAFLQAQKTDATALPVDVMGFGYIQDVNTPVVHNFSQSGRRLRYVDEQVISDCANNAAMLVLALGHNDQVDVDVDPGGAYAAAFTQRIEWVIQYCKANNTFLVVPDFCWTTGNDSFTRSELQRAAKETGGTYIPFPNLIKPDGSAPDSSYLTSTINMWVDGSHPNVKGNKWIAETLAEWLGLSITSKKEAISKADYWMPMALPAGTSNSFTSPDSVSAYRINGSELNVRFSVQRAAGGSFPTGTFPLQSGLRVNAPIELIGTSIRHAGLIREDTNALTSSFVIDLVGAVTLKVTDGTWINDQAASGKVDIRLS